MNWQTQEAKMKPDMECHGGFANGDFARFELSGIVLFTLLLRRTRNNMRGNALFIFPVFEGTSTGVYPQWK